jgi:hypothetical protein
MSHDPLSIRRAHGERGTSLILALAFLSLLGTFTAAILTVTYTSFKTTQSARGSHDKHYGADGGADVAVQLLRQDSSYCPSASGTPSSLPDQTIDGRTVHITCQTLSGSSIGGGGGTFSQYSLVVTGYPNPNGSLPSMDSGINVDGKTHADTVKFTGPVFDAGGFTFGSNTPVINITNDLHQYNDVPKTYCAINQGANITTGDLDVDGTWSCDLAATFPVPDPVPTLKVPTTSAPNKVVQGSCTIFFPGTYTTAPTFDKNDKYYFASGVYYFANAGQIYLAGEIFGGQPGPGESQQMTTATPCSNDAAVNALVPGAATGSGVQLVLGGSSKLRVDDHQKDKIELFSRVPAVPANEGTAGVTVYAPRTNGTNYVKWDSDKVLAMDGNKTTMIIHGLFYAPTGFVNKAYALQNPGNAATFAGGLVAQRLTLFFDNQSSSGATASVARIIPSAPPTPRTVVVTATADPVDPGEAPTVIKAVVQLGTGAGTPATVLSWRTV